MSKLIYLKRYNKNYQGGYRESLPDHRGHTYMDPALFGGFFGPKPTAIPMSQRLQEYLNDFYEVDSSDGPCWDDEPEKFDPVLFDSDDFTPEEFMIVAAEQNERGRYPFKTSYYWLTLSKWGDGRTHIDISEAASLLRRDDR